MYDVADHCILVRYGEIALKGRNRPVFINRLVHHIERALIDLPVKIEKESGRIMIVPKTDQTGDVNLFSNAVIDRVRSVFGIVSVSPAIRVTPEIAAIEEAVIHLMREQHAPGLTFKVETRRANKRFPMQSPEVSRHLGGVLLKHFSDIQVNVHAPDLTVFVEIRDDACYVYKDVLQGHGGLPVGVSGKALLLLSGGIDSPVAGWSAMRRGIALEAVHFHSFPHTSERSLLKVLDLAKILGRNQGVDIPVHVVHFTPMQDEIQRHVKPESRITVMRRMMVRMAEGIARRRGIMALVTGESVGQVASQTLESMAAINAVTTMPIIRPLVTADKNDIVDLAKQIDTYETSVLPYDDCCTLFVPDRPETRPKIDRLEMMEAKIDVDELVKQAVDDALKPK